MTEQRVTTLLKATAEGDTVAEGRLWSCVYEELHRTAGRQLAGDGARRVISPTTLVSEAYVRLVGSGDLPCNSRRHFFCAAAEAMRRIIVDDARKRSRTKRGGGRPVDVLRSDLAADAVVRRSAPSPHDDLLAINEALERFEAADPRRADVVKLRFFAGLSVADTAAALGISTRKVEMDWRFARAWLHREMEGE